MAALLLHYDLLTMIKELVPGPDVMAGATAKDFTTRVAGKHVIKLEHKIPRRIWFAHVRAEDSNYAVEPLADHVVIYPPSHNRLTDSRHQDELVLLSPSTKTCRLWWNASHRRMSRHLSVKPAITKPAVKMMFDHFVRS